jgi:aryl-phospho-beta-D-glucosidase BglC (GH1 family)
MNGELSNGLPSLATSANRIVIAATGQPVLLRGVNRSGLEWAEPDEDGFCSAAEISRAEIEFIVKVWGCNIIRLPLNQDWVLKGRGEHSSNDYLKDLDRVVRWASRAGAYTLLDLQWLDADRPFGGSRNFVAPLPNLQSLDFWHVLASRYRDEPAVLYDLFNEPHDRLPDDPYPLIREDGSLYPPTHRRVTAAEWHPWALRLIDVIRSTHPHALIFVSGINWGYDLRGMPLDRANLVYSTHVYRNKGSNWADAFGNLAANLPVFAGEWGGHGEDQEWGRTLVDYFDALEMGWTAWSWSNEPYLVTRFTPTEFGDIVLAQLRRTLVS